MLFAMSTQKHSKKASPKDWHPADVIAAVRKKGSSLRKLSLAAGLHPRTLNVALQHSYPKAQAAIAGFLGVAPKSIWPSRYHRDGSHKRGLRGTAAHQRRQSTAVAGRVNGKDKWAA